MLHSLVQNVICIACIMDADYQRPWGNIGLKPMLNCKLKTPWEQINIGCNQWKLK